MIEERIKVALASKKLSVNKLSQELQMNQVTLNDQLRGRTTLSSKTIELILPYIDNISAEWLLRGEGSMERGFFNQMVGRLGSCGDGDIFQSVTSDVDVEDLKRQIAELKKEKVWMQSLIDKLSAK